MQRTYLQRHSDLTVSIEIDTLHLTQSVAPVLAYDLMTALGMMSLVIKMHNVRLGRETTLWPRKAETGDPPRASRNLPEVYLVSVTLTSKQAA